MTRVAFHFNVPEPLHYVCRLSRKALRGGARLVVTGPAPRLAELDRMLWTFEPLEFVPHWRGADVTALPTKLARTPVVLLDRVADAQDFDVLVNVGREVPADFDQFDRVVEVVGQGDDERSAARHRWRHYAGLSLKVDSHEVSA